MALTPNMRTGIYRGKINKEIKRLPLFKLTAREAPIVPIRISVGVPSNMVIVKYNIPLELIERIKPNIGDKITSKSPVVNQYERALAKTKN